MTNEEVDRILSARVPGGSEVRDWFLPHETDRGLENVRNIVRLIASTKRDNCAPKWQPIDTAPKDNGRKIFVVKAFDVLLSGRKYTSDPYCVWRDKDEFVRWPHKFDPTHWMPLPDAPNG